MVVVHLDRREALPNHDVQNWLGRLRHACPGADDLQETLAALGNGGHPAVMRRGQKPIVVQALDDQDLSADRPEGGRQRQPGHSSAQDDQLESFARRCRSCPIQDHQCLPNLWAYALDLSITWTLDVPTGPKAAAIPRWHGVCCFAKCASGCLDLLVARLRTSELTASLVCWRDSSELPPHPRKYCSLARAPWCDPVVSAADCARKAMPSGRLLFGQPSP